MPQSWTLDRPDTRRQLPLDDVAALLDAARPGAAPSATLGWLLGATGADHVSMLQYPDGAPALVDSAAREHRAARVTVDCFERYRRAFWRLDAVTGLARRLRNESHDADAPVIALRQHRDDVPDAAWREAIYEREGLCDRLLLLYAPAARASYGISLYRDAARGPYADGEIERVLGLAPLLRLVHRNLLGAPAAPQPMAARIAAAERRLAERAPALSPREREVCARIAVGVSVDGIAADLSLAPSSVMTLRKRGYAKLGVHDRLALARWVG